MTALRLLLIFLASQLPGVAQTTHTYVGHYSYPSSGSEVYKDPKSGVLIYVETDGRHLAAISPGGKLLWSRDPFKDLPYYRMKDPQVAGLGPISRWEISHGRKSGEFVAISLTNSQFGLLRISDGEFEFEGQD
jgi:hypothetical protein